jgi:N-acetylmuramoyl-L-alanine amidase
MAAIDGKILLTKNDCYKRNQKMTPNGIVVHSTGATNPYLKRYIAPDDGVIGKNSYNNDWNRSGLDVAVHAFIGKDKKGNVKCYQTLPFNICCWGVGGGSKGSYNYNPAYIQFEICEDSTADKAYCKKTYDKAVEFCAYLCKKYNINVNNIVGHYEAAEKGYGSNHADPRHWWKKHGYSMNSFRKAVKAKLTSSTASKPASKPAIKEIYRVGTAWENEKCVNQKGAYESLANAKVICDKYADYSVFNSKGDKIYTSAKKAATSSFKAYKITVTSADGVNIRKGAGTNYAVTGSIPKGGAYTIVAEKNGKGAKKWGKLKSGAGWIALDFTKKI